MSEVLFPLSEWLGFFRSGHPLLDVRAEIEFQQGHIPGSTNLPILLDSEREKVGWTYKNEGPEKAVRLGHEIVSGSNKEKRVSAWTQFLLKSDQSVITCFRGGMRSQIAQTWCQEAGVVRPRMDGGYKALREFLTQTFNQQITNVPLTVLSGPTGAGKTFLLRSIQGRLLFDLELRARHRGSAFGGYIGGQPAQAVFENHLAVDLIRAEPKRKQPQERVLIEDESRMIGTCSQPEPLFNHLRASPLIMIEEDLKSRTELTYDDYIMDTPINGGDEVDALIIFDRYEVSLSRISSRLGGLRTSEVLKDLSFAKQSYLLNRDLVPNQVWISKLLDWYYDPLYLRSLEKREPRILFRGSREEVRQFLESGSDVSWE